MAVTYVRFGGHTVSQEWATVLTAARGAVAFMLDSGHRTMAEQKALYDHYLRFGSPLAAKPAPNAPHIRAGRLDHAIDVNALDGGAGRLAGWLRRKGAKATFPVHREPWHIEVPLDDLRKLAAQLLDPLRGYTASERQLIRAYDHLRRARHNRARRRALREDMTAQRKRIWRAAQPTSSGGDGHGWNHANRARRYRSLLARTT
jgi:hypothetical protein